MMDRLTALFRPDRRPYTRKVRAARKVGWEPGQSEPDESITVAVAERVRPVREGVGSNSAWLYAMESFSWRKVRNRREGGALAGLTPTPYQSGDSHREQGIAKAGNRHVLAMAIEIAWGWLRCQPDSALTRWYQERFGNGRSRLRSIGIVALARKLLIALLRFLETGVVP